MDNIENKNTNLFRYNGILASGTTEQAPAEQSRYFILNSSSIYEDLQEKVKLLLDNESLKNKYGYEMENLTVDVDEFYWGDESRSFLENIDNCMEITFHDDPTPEKDEEPYYTMSFLFEEEFKQINFNNMQVYSACTIHTRSGIDQGRKRDYYSLSIDIENAICNCFALM